MLRNRVLLVDDEEGPRFGVRRFLKSHDFDVDEASDCATARIRFRQFRQLEAFLGIQTERFFAKDMQARIQCVLHHLGVKARRRGDEGVLRGDGYGRVREHAG